MMRRNFLVLLLASALSLAGLTFAPREATAAAPSFPKMEIKLAHIIAVETSIHAGSMKFAELMKERTGGAVNVQVFPNSQLGNEKDVTEQVRNGMIQMAVIGIPFLANLNGWGPLGVIQMPFVLKQDTEEAQNAMMNKLLRLPFMTEALAKAPEVSGVRALDLNWFYGMRHVTTGKKQVTKVDDLKGMKIRTPDAPLFRLPIAALGAAVTPLAFSEVYTALQMGVVDGQENPANTIFTSKFYEVQKYMSLTGHMTQSLLPIINEKFFQSLSPELRAIFEKSARDAGEFQSQRQIKLNIENVEDMKKKGLIVNAVNRKEFAEKTKDAWKEFESQLGKGLYEKIVAAQN